MTTREINITNTQSSIEGGCNACTDHFSPVGAVNHMVWKIDLRGISIRLCDACITDLMEKAKSEFRNHKNQG